MQAAGEGDQQNKTTKTPLSVKNNQNEMTVTWVWIMNTHHYFNAKIMILEESRFSFLGYFNGYESHQIKNVHLLGSRC